MNASFPGIGTSSESTVRSYAARRAPHNALQGGCGAGRTPHSPASPPFRRARAVPVAPGSDRPRLLQAAPAIRAGPARPAPPTRPAPTRPPTRSWRISKPDVQETAALAVAGHRVVLVRGHEVGLVVADLRAPPPPLPRGAAPASRGRGGRRARTGLRCATGGGRRGTRGCRLCTETATVRRPRGDAGVDEVVDAVVVGMEDLGGARLDRLPGEAPVAGYDGVLALPGHEVRRIGRAVAVGHEAANTAAGRASRRAARTGRGRRPRRRCPRRCGRSRSGAARPRVPSRAGNARPACSQVRRNGDAPSGRTTSTGPGSPSPSRRSPAPRRRSPRSSPSGLHSLHPSAPVPVRAARLRAPGFPKTAGSPGKRRMFQCPRRCPAGMSAGMSAGRPTSLARAAKAGAPAREGSVIEVAHPHEADEPALAVLDGGPVARDLQPGERRGGHQLAVDRPSRRRRSRSRAGTRAPGCARRSSCAARSRRSSRAPGAATRGPPRRWRARTARSPASGRRPCATPWTVCTARVALEHTMASGRSPVSAM